MVQAVIHPAVLLPLKHVPWLSTPLTIRKWDYIKLAMPKGHPAKISNPFSRHGWHLALLYLSQVLHLQCQLRLPRKMQNPSWSIFLQEWFRGLLELWRAESLFPSEQVTHISFPCPHYWYWLTHRTIHSPPWLTDGSVSDLRHLILRLRRSLARYNYFCAVGWRYSHRRPH